MTEDVIRIVAEPEEAIATLWDGPHLELPADAVLNGDGSVSLTLSWPFELVYRQAGGGEVVRTEPVKTVVLHRLTGADVLKVRQAKDSTRAAMIASARMNPAKWELWAQKMDARDETTIGQIVAALMGVGASGLPAEATDHGDAVALALLFPATDDEGTVWRNLRVPRLTAAQRRQMSEADESLAWAMRHATGLSPKLAKSLLHAMDGADVVALGRVINFLS